MNETMKYCKVLLVIGSALLYPLLASPFFVFQIAAQALVLGTIALSLSFLASQGGIVSLAPMTIAGVAGYTLAILGSAQADLGATALHLPWWVAAPLSVLIGTLAAVGIGALAGRTQGVYTIMITLAIGVAFFYFTQQNVDLFNGYQGIAQINPPVIAGIDFRAPTAFFYASLLLAVSAYGAIVYLGKTPFGLAFQGTRDNARRMRSLGFNVTLLRLVSHAIAGVIAACAGIFWLWYHARISPGSVGISAMINVLVVAILGSINRPIGAFIGALVFVFLQNFAMDFISRERFNLLIGMAFLGIVLLSPDGLLGLWQRLREFVTQGRRPPPQMH